ncbi:hypothetical protein SHKM778_19820 [Streptomyces sp. KM77-8]|uniref:Uncharacterized protein n=1 Tax=Streptomyces haneummycinicus TaxID=3074435 RepID=A0AAT9HE21_9ACTN
MYEDAGTLGQNARVTSERRADYQELVDEISELLGAPATLENRDFELIVFGAYDSEGDLDPSALDPVRTRSILTRRSTAAVRAWFEGFGITRATGPVRVPRTPRRACTGAASVCRYGTGVSSSVMSGCSTTTRARPRGSWTRPCG